MPGRQSFRPGGGGVVKQQAEFDQRIADDAGIRRASGDVFFAKILNDALAERLPDINDEKPDAQHVGRSLRVAQIRGFIGFGRMLRAVKQFARLRQPHRDAENRMPLFEQQGGGDGTIHAAAHGDGDDWGGLMFVHRLGCSFLFCVSFPDVSVSCQLLFSRRQHVWNI